MNLLSSKGFQYSCVLCPGHFWAELLQLTLQSCTWTDRRRRVSGGVDFSVCIGLTWQGFGRGLLWGRLVLGWLLWEENRKFPMSENSYSCQLQEVRKAVPFIWALTYSLEETRRFWHLLMACRMEWPSNCKCIQVLGAEQKEYCTVFLIFL